jgi:hypothetical protein
MSALHEGFEVVLLIDAVAAVNLQPGDGAQAIAEMEQAGATLLLVADLWFEKRAFALYWKQLVRRKRKGFSIIHYFTKGNKTCATR